METALFWIIVVVIICFAYGVFRKSYNVQAKARDRSPAPIAERFLLPVPEKWRDVFASAFVTMFNVIGVALFFFVVVPRVHPAQRDASWGASAMLIIGVFVWSACYSAYRFGCDVRRVKNGEGT